MPSINGRTFTEQIRDVIYVFWDNENKQLREQPIMTFIPRKISDDRKALLRLFTKLLVDTDFINDLGAREYLASKGETYKDVANRLNLNADTVRKRVFYYCSVSKLKGKIVEKFGDTFLTEIIQYPNHDITSIEQAINKELIKYLGLKDLQKDIQIDIPRMRGCTDLNDEEFEEFIDIIKPYITKFKETNQMRLTTRQCSYFWWLVNNQYCLKDKDLERFKILSNHVKQD